MACLPRKRLDHRQIQRTTILPCLLCPRCTQLFPHCSGARLTSNISVCPRGVARLQSYQQQVVLTSPCLGPPDVLSATLRVIQRSLFHTPSSRRFNTLQTETHLSELPLRHANCKNTGFKSTRNSSALQILTSSSVGVVPSCIG